MGLTAFNIHTMFTVYNTHQVCDTQEEKPGEYCDKIRLHYLRESTLKGNESSLIEHYVMSAGSDCLQYTQNVYCV